MDGVEVPAVLLPDVGELEEMRLGAIEDDLRTTSVAGTAAGTATRRRRIRLATLVGIVTTAVVVAVILTQGEAQPSAEGLAAGVSGAAVQSVAPTGYWNAHLNEWVELGATVPAAPNGGNGR